MARRDFESIKNDAVRFAVRSEQEKWNGVIAEKDIALAEQAVLIAKLRARLGE
jgi:predicted transcriptional regulator